MLTVIEWLNVAMPGPADRFSEGATHDKIQTNSVKKFLNHMVHCCFKTVALF